MENIYNIISSYENNIYDMYGSFKVYLGKINEESIYADIKLVYMDDPVCEEEYYDGFYLDFNIKVLDKNYILTYLCTILYDR